MSLIFMTVGFPVEKRRQRIGQALGKKAEFWSILETRSRQGVRLAMPQVPSRVTADNSKDVKAGRTTRLLLGCMSAMLATVVVAAGDPSPTPDSDARSANQMGQSSSLLHNSEAGNKSPPPAAGSTSGSEEDCE